MPIAHGCSTNSLIILLFDRSKYQVTALALFCDYLEHFLILIGIGTTPDNYRNTDCRQNITNGLSRRFRTRILIVWIDTFELDYNGICAKVIHTLFGPSCRVGNNIFEMGQYRLRPLFRLHIPDFHGNNRFIGHVSFKGIKRITCLTSHGNGRVSFAYGNFLDAAGIGFLLDFKSHFCLLAGE